MRRILRGYKLISLPNRALVGNLLIITAVTLDHHLHTPLYFFLMNLSILDLGFISVTIPKSMLNSLMNTRSISYSGCVTQLFLFIFLRSADLAILTVMAYDRYIAFCQPERVMNREACVQMAAGACISSILYSALHTRSTFAISFCGGNKVDQFFCDIPQLLKLACSDLYLNIPYKAFSTCLPHLTVVSLFIITGGFAYLKPTSSSTSGLDLVLDVFYLLVPPVLNPVIYSMRNKEIKAALRKLIVWKLFTKNKTSTFL
ncbi:olfactory receptor 14A16-like [Emydura macquarii macquarii]|uniref:olfactory receptor 14A16-like n=1 Tax=Emydura macquarii macquarii TaxID=1129001 RepID=UPI00352A3831